MDYVQIAVGQRWRRVKDNTIVTVDRVVNIGSQVNPYLDVYWRSAKRRGACMQDYWLRDYVPAGDGED